MPSINRVTIIGNLAREPETRYTPEGTASICTVTVATDHRFKDSKGQSQEETEWHRVVFFGHQAEVASKYLHKGKLVYVEGRLRTRKWTTQEGQERHSTEIIAEILQILSSREKNVEEVATTEEVATEEAPKPGFSFF